RVVSNNRIDGSGASVARGDYHGGVASPAGSPCGSESGADRSSAPREDSVATPSIVTDEAVTPPLALSRPTLPGRAWLVLAWLGATALPALPVVAGLVSLWRLRRHCQRLVDGPLPVLVKQLAAHLGIRRSVVLLESPSRSMPMTWGMLRPIILLPEE